MVFLTSPNKVKVYLGPYSLCLLYQENIIFFAGQDIDSKALCVPGKCFTTILHPQAPNSSFEWKLWFCGRSSQVPWTRISLIFLHYSHTFFSISDFKTETYYFYTKLNGNKHPLPHLISDQRLPLDLYTTLSLK